MKIKFLAFTVLLCGSLLTVSAQSQGKRFYFGFAFNPESDILWNGRLAHNKHFKTGFEFKVRITKRLALSSGLMVDNAIYRHSETNLEEKYRTSLVQVPLRADLRFNQKKVSPFLTAGGMFDVVGFFGYSFKQNGRSGSLNNTESIKTYSGWIIDPGIFVGFGLDIQASSLKLQVYPYYEITILPHASVSTLGLAIAILLGA